LGALQPEGGFMRRYEMIFISDPDVSDDDRKQLFEKTKDLIDSQGGFLVLFDDWGTKKLAYEIKKKPRGYYVRLDFCGDGSLVAEMERSFRIDDRVMKFMTIVLDKNADLEKIKQDLIAKEEEAKAATAAAAAATAAAQDETVEDASAPTEIKDTETKSETKE
jgi:small subunit ribosomal protein S6